MIGFMKRLWRDKRGNAIMITGACLPLLIGAAGLASDTIQWTLWKRQLQRAADSAALSGVYDLENSGTQASARLAVSHDLTLNQHTWMSLKSGYPIVTFPSDTSVLSHQVSTSLAVQQPLAFSSFFMTTAPIIIANATASAIPGGGDACVQALETSASKVGITSSGNTTVDMPDCILYSNSPATNSAAAGGSSSVTALAISTVGGVQQSNNWHVQSYRPYSPPLEDPFSKVTPDPSQMKCTTAALDEKTDFSKLPAGTNCFSSLSVGSNKSLSIPANFGPIYLNGGSANFQGSFTCAGCTVVLTNKDAASPIGTLGSNAQANVNISAPTSGTYKGIAIYQDRRATDCNGCNKLNGGSSSVVTGAVYFPSQEIWFNGGTSPYATCTMLVARRVVLTGNSKFKGLSKCETEGLPQGNSTRLVRLVA